MIRTTLDLETFWSKTHTLKKMDPITYAMHPDTELISCSLKHGTAKPVCVFGEGEIRRMLADYDWSSIFAIAHNMSGFDALILAWRLGLRPKMWGCTLAMARPLHAKTDGLSLDRLVRRYALGYKDNTALMQTQGKNLADFTEQERRAMAAYNIEDTLQCHALYERLVPHYTMQELWHIDATIRMLVEPGFTVNQAILAAGLAAERQRKQKSVLQLGRYMLTSPLASTAIKSATSVSELEEAVRVDMASTPKFAAFLAELGVTVPTKGSPKDPDRLIPALAKSDQAFLDLEEDENPIIGAAVRARLAVKSTILESRIEAFQAASKNCSGLLPMPIKYCGADTTGRDSGFLYNPQNMPAIRGDATPAHSLRMSLEAPAGMVVGVADLSGIELRVNHFLWKVKSTMGLYAADSEADLYRAASALANNCTPGEVTKLQRQLEKTKQLGLGFGAGHVTFRKVARTKAMGGIVMSLEESKAHVDSWRTMYAEICVGWRTCDAALMDIFAGNKRAIDPWGMTETCAEGIRLPSGRVIRYPNLRQIEDGQWADGRAKTSWVYADGRHKARIYGPKIDENCLSGDSLVLTNNGIKVLTSVSALDQLWDGGQWVQHSGIKFMGIKETINFGGTKMTPDHKVFSNGKWNKAEDTQPGQASQTYNRLYRLPGGESGRAGNGPVRRAQNALEGSVQLRDGSRAGQQILHRWMQVVRVFARFSNRSGKPNPRNEQDRTLRGLPSDVRPLFPDNTPGVEKLWSARYKSLRALAGVVREFLGGHVQWLPAWPGAGQARQQRGLLGGELSVGDSAGQYSKQTQQPHYQHPYGTHAAMAGGGGFRYRQDDPMLSGHARMASGGYVRQAECVQPVYDIINSGPNHCFTVIQPTGSPILVHNCVQALARDILFDNTLAFFKLTGYRPKLRVHDELVYLFPEAEAEAHLAALHAIMRKPPRWWPELITWSEGSYANAYGLCK